MTRVLFITFKSFRENMDLCHILHLFPKFDAKAASVLCDARIAVEEETENQLCKALFACFQSKFKSDVNRDRHVCYYILLLCLLG